MQEIKNKLYLLLSLAILLVTGCQFPQSYQVDFLMKQQAQPLGDFIAKQQLTLVKKGNGFAVAYTDLACDCHVQGIGWEPDGRQIVLTCQDLCAKKSGAFLLLYQEDQLLPLDVAKGAADVFSTILLPYRLLRGFSLLPLQLKEARILLLSFMKLKTNN